MTPARTSATTVVFGRLNAGRWLSLSAATMIMIVGAIAANYPAILSGKVVDQVVRGELSSFRATIPFLALLALSFLVRELAAGTRKYLVERITCQIERDELRRLSTHLLQLDLSAFWGQRVGALNVRIHRSLEGLTRLLKIGFMEFLPAVVLSLVALAMAGQRSLMVVAIVTTIFAIAVVLTMVQVATQKGIRMSLFAAKEDVSANLTEVLLGLDYVRVAGGLEVEHGRMAELSERMRSKEFLHHRWMIGFDGSKQLLEGAGLVLVVGTGAWQVAQGSLSGGDVLTLALLYAAVATPLRDLHRILDEGFESVLKVRELANLYVLQSDSGIPGTTPPTREAPVITAKELGFRVRDGVLLKGINLTIQDGEWVGVAGSSGCGKSTLLKLILGISPNYSGSLRVFGAEARMAQKSEMWRQIGYVGQVPHIIKGSLRDNLAYGLIGDTSNDEAMLSALASAGLHQRFLRSGRVCLDEPIEEQGRNMSGGERQRLAIARLFLRSPRLIVLDEATSALDYENEWQLIKEMRARFAGVTAIVVAHRLEALRETDRILVMREGEILSEGAFAALSLSDNEFMRVAHLAAPA